MEFQGISKEFTGISRDLKWYTQAYQVYQLYQEFQVISWNFKGSQEISRDFMGYQGISLRGILCNITQNNYTRYIRHFKGLQRNSMDFKGFNGIQETSSNFKQFQAISSNI